MQPPPPLGGVATSAAHARAMQPPPPLGGVASSAAHATALQPPPPLGGMATSAAHAKAMQPPPPLCGVALMAGARARALGRGSRAPPFVVWLHGRLKRAERCEPPPPLVEGLIDGRRALRRVMRSLYCRLP
jgi:hypothetical protein